MTFHDHQYYGSAAALSVSNSYPAKLSLGNGCFMAPEKTAKRGFINTTIGEFVEAVYDAAMEEYMDEIMARRIAMQMLVRKLRLQHKLREKIINNKPLQVKKKAHLENEHKRKRSSKG